VDYLTGACVAAGPVTAFRGEARAAPGGSARAGGTAGDPVVAFLAEAEVLAVLARAGPLPQAVIAQRVGPGYQALVPEALARLAGQDLAWPTASGSGLWTAAS